MIYVTIGTATKGIDFNRLIKKMDEIASRITEKMVMQIGEIDYRPQNAEYFFYVPYQESLQFFKTASLIIGHCGTGTILNALRFKVPLIVVPRRIQYGELDRDDHQLEIARRLEGRGWVEVVYDMEELESKVMQMIREKRKVLGEEVSPERKRLIQFLKKFIEQGERKAG